MFSALAPNPAADKAFDSYARSRQQCGTEITKELAFAAFRNAHSDGRNRAAITTEEVKSDDERDECDNLRRRSAPSAKLPIVDEPAAHRAHVLARNDDLLAG